MSFVDIKTSELQWVKSDERLENEEPHSLAAHCSKNVGKLLLGQQRRKVQ